MSNHDNHRREEDKRTEHGPSWESPNPGEGCNATHVARARKKWKDRKHRALRRTGQLSVKFEPIKPLGDKVLPSLTEES